MSRFVTRASGGRRRAFAYMSTQQRAGGTREGRGAVTGSGAARAERPSTSPSPWRPAPALRYVITELTGVRSPPRENEVALCP